MCLLSRIPVNVPFLSRSEEIIPHLLGFELYYSTVQHSLLIHTTRIDAQRLFILTSSFSFMNMTMQSQYWLILVDHGHYSLASNRHHRSTGISRSQVLG